MSYGSTAWAALERWSPIAFLAAGGLFVLPTATFGIGAATGTGNVVSPIVIFVLMLVVFVGLLGLYPRLAEENPILALGGVGLLAVTTAIIVSTLGAAALPNGPTFGKPHIQAIVTAVVVGSTLTLAAFGVASLRAGVESRLVGGPLLTMAAGDLSIFVAMQVYGDPSPAWVSFAVGVLFVVSLGSIGYVLRTENTSAESSESPGDVAAS
jgi:hypothetical protein